MKTIYLLRWRLAVLLFVTFLAACGGSYDDEKRQQYIDKCIIEAGPQSEKNNVADYCYAKWRESQREK